MVDERYDPAFQRGYDPAPELPRAEADARAEALEARGRRNPWLAILWMLAALLLGGGGFLLTQTASPVGSDVVPVLVLPVVFAALAPWLVGVGLGAVVAAVFVHAVRHRG